MFRRRPPPRFDVEVTGGKGAVIGDYASVIQVFNEAPAPLASKIRTREFTSLIEERTRDFVGREYIFAAIDDFLGAKDFDRGYVVLQGEPGIGKTAVIGQLVKQRGCVHHFNVGPLGIRSAHAFLSNLCAQLIVSYKLDYTSLPAEATTDGGFLSRLLSEAAADPHNLPLLVAVDALDEADDIGVAAGANRLFLPPSVPRGVYFVVSTREESDYRLFVEPRRDVYIRDDDPRNLHDVATCIREFLAANRERMWPQLEQWKVTDSEFVTLLGRKSGGNFMYLVHVLRDIAQGILNARDVDDIRNLPQGLKAYYWRHWNEMRSPDPERFRRYQEPVVCLLATAREPVSFHQLLDWTSHFWRRVGWDLRELDPVAVKDVLRTWREFLNESKASDGSRYRIYHTSFQDFLADEVGLRDYHETIGDTALSKIPGFPTNQ